MIRRSSANTETLSHSRSKRPLAYVDSSRLLPVAVRGSFPPKRCFGTHKTVYQRRCAILLTSILLEPAGPIPLHDSFLHHHEAIVAAYRCCCADEKEVLQELERTPGNSSLTIDLMNIRIIGHLIDILSWNQEDQAVAHISKTIREHDRGGYQR
ncbi:hypothetical protein OE88DRAFT_2840 [Heliocybe sulcata]|uniref:Uncharacterized protein n=1 Tax=Heliocybe sulcata TaxID=5364 RepID=A0A5C3NF03_9AGAM|nr:hypothetical protein OE88DRAFT_2840 [Heliocybe sulcata]